VTVSFKKTFSTKNNRVNSAARSAAYAAGQDGGSTSVTLYITSINDSPSNGRFRAASSNNMHPADLIKTNILAATTSHIIFATERQWMQQSKKQTVLLIQRSTFDN